MTKYEEMLYRVKPDPDILPWLLDQGKLSTHGMVYRRHDLRELLTGLRERAVRCTCGHCGQSFFVDYVPGPGCAAYAKAPYGIMWEGQMLASGDDWLCPECGAQVKLTYYGHVSTPKATDSQWVQELRVVEGYPVLLQWHYRVWIDKDGRGWNSAEIDRAFVFESKKAVRLTAAQSFMGRWHSTGVLKERKRCIDDLGYVTNFFPQDLSILNGTVLENAKLDLYLKTAGDKYPVSYLRLYLKRPKVETLLTCGMSNILSELIREELMQGVGYASAGQTTGNIPRLRWIDWKAVRPGEMLHLDRGELRQAILEKWSLEQLKSYVLIRDAFGERMPVGELPGTYREAEIIVNLGDKPGRIMRYLKKQGKPANYLRDYYDMAEKVGHDMSAPGVRYPKNLVVAHDQAMKLQKYKEKEGLREMFLKRAEELRRYAWESEGILIRPVETERELIDEGDILDHCVARYAENHSEGRCSILLIRRTKKPERPWYTLNLDAKRLTVIENHGKGNCEPTVEVEHFVEAWLNHIRQVAGNRKEKSA